MSTSTDEVTQWLLDWSNGDQEALNKLMPFVYDELRLMARRYMARQNPGHTLQATALIHETFLKLIGHEDKSWQSRAHFYGVAAQAMRHILVDYARSRQYAKRGGGATQVPLDAAVEVAEERVAEIVALDDALSALAKVDPRKSRVVELRYFSGLTVEETAEMLGISPITVTRDWNLAKAWLRRELSRETRNGI